MTHPAKTLIREIWESFQRLPLWVRLWVALWLVPINLLSVGFLSSPNGLLIALLAVGGMAPNAVLMVVERGFSSLMALPHLIIWPASIVVAVNTALSHPDHGGFAVYLWGLAATNLVSILFDVPDFIRWVKGKREVA